MKVECPLSCGKVYEVEAWAGHTLRNRVRDKTILHLLNRHPSLSLRERSLLADIAADGPNTLLTWHLTTYVGTAS